MGAKRQLIFWLLAATAGVALLAAVLIWQHRSRSRVVTLLTGDPASGAFLFEVKGCSHCHAVNGSGGRLGPDLGARGSLRSGLNDLVTTMWNHAPEMWKRMQVEHLALPVLRESDMADLFAFLYVARYMDEPGDPARGARLFEEKGCIRCHSVQGVGGTVGPDVSRISGIDTPIAWTQSMWNHAPAMQAGMQRLGLTWPRFTGSEMNDLLAFVREKSSAPRVERSLLPANPSAGQRLFQTKSCVACHSVSGEGGHLGPELGARRDLPLSMVQFAGAMWNHSPEMFRAMKQRKLDRPTFSGQEMADLMAFLGGLRFFEPTGSPYVGESVFRERGCARCHGFRGDGSSWGPPLRGRGRTFGSVEIATALWSHGPDMYRQVQALGLSWPKLRENDLGDLIAFLNAPPQEKR